jgi:two-component sensor histidine kinase
VTISPVRDRTGKVIGASKIARDIDATKKAQAAQKLLLREMNHRVKNLFAVASGVVALSARSAETAKELAHSIQERLAALARAHDLTLMADEASAPRSVHLHELLKTILSPYDTAEGRILIQGPDLECGASVQTSFALLVHEFATNSVKYGALSTPSGRVTIAWVLGEDLELTWTEQGGPTIESSVAGQGFGSTLANLTAQSINGKIDRDWRSEGLIIRLVVPRSKLGG